MNSVKHFLILALTLTMSLGAWAQNNNTVPVTQDNNLDWNFTMPDYDAQVDVEYYNGYVLTLACNGGGTVEFSGGILPQGVTAIPGGTANTYYVISGTVVTITATANENYYFKNWTDENNNVFGNSYTLTLTLTITGDTTLTANFIRDFEGSGTEDDPYLIPDIAKWRLLSYRVQKGNTYSGKYFKQTDSICVDTYSVGTYVNNDESLCSTFAGTYDGDGHALEIRYINTPYNNKAPFVYVDGATIKNVHTTGSIKTDQQFASGLVARTKTNDRTTTIINCRVSVSIQSTVSSNYKDCTHGGLVAVTNSKTNLIGCIFDGALIGAHSYRNGGFIGWADQNASVNFIDCIFAPDSVSMLENQSCTFSRARKDTSLHFTNSYYARSYGAEQGKKLRSITAGTDVTALGLAGAATVYNVSGITAYAGNNGLKYSDMFFAGDTDVVNLTLGHTDRTAESLVFSAYSASNGGTFSGDTLTMPNDSTIVSANYIQNLLMLTLNSDGNGTVGFSGDTLPQGVTAVPGSTANTYYVVSGTEVTVKARANENYGIENWTNENSSVMGTDSTLTITITGDTTLTANFVRDFEGSGTENDPYLIPNTEKWTLLSNRVKEGKGYYGKYFLQTDSIFAGRVYVGAYSERPFGGIYDGGGHVLEFLDVTLSNKNRAPFICVDGATIQNLHVMGTIKTNNQFVSGLIARVVVNDKTTTIINCRSSIRIESVKTKDFDGTHGGFVAVTDAAVNLIGCVFDGALIGAKTRSSGGFIGWTENHASVNFIDCIFAPDSLSMGDSLSCTFSRARRDTSLHFTNCYYAQAFGKEQGKKLRSITAGADVTTLGLAGTATVYNVSGITAYAGNNGLKYGDMFFAGDTDVVNLTLGHADRSAEGMIFDSYSASNGASFNGDTLTMANDSTVVSANYIQNLMLTLNSDGNGTVSFCGDTLPQGVTLGSTANTYYVVSGTEVCMKATPAEHNYMQKWNNEAVLNSNEAVNTSFTVTKDTTLTAYFVQKPILTLGTNPSNPIRGTVTIAGNSLPNYVAQIGTSNSYYVDYDSSVTVVATPSEHYHLASWSNTGGNDLQQVVTMTQDMEVTGVFAIDTFTLTLQTNDINKGSVAVTNHNGNPAIVSHDPDANGTRTYKVNYGTEVIIKATPKEHYHLDSWSNGVTVNTDDIIHVIVTTDSTIMATFDTNTYVLNVVSADAAMGSVSGSNPAAKHFLSYEISATANNGCHFVQWNDGNTDNPRMVTLSSDSTFTATFEITPANLSWSSNDFTGYVAIDFNNWKPTLTNSHSVSVRYGCVEGDDPDHGGIAVDASTGIIGDEMNIGHATIKSGTFHIYAVHETDQNYYYDSVVYTLHVLPSALVGLSPNIADAGTLSMPNATDVPSLTHHYATVGNLPTVIMALDESVDILAEPATGYHFNHWGIPLAPQEVTTAAYTYQFTIPISVNFQINLLTRTLRAYFDTNTYVLNVVSADAAMGSVSGSNPAAKHFLSYEISATPNNGCHFVQWNDGNTDNPRTVTLSSDSTFTATFAATPAELAWSTNTFTGYTYIDFNNYKPTLTNPHNVSVRYGLVENVNSVKVNQETGYITNSFNVPVIYTQGTYHIYAVHETDQTYYYDSVVYTLNVNRAALVGILRNIEEGGSNAFLNADADLTHAYSSNNNSMIAYLAPGAGFTVEATANEGYHFSKWQTGNNEDGYTDYATTSTVVYTAPATITSMSTIGLKSVFDTNTYVLNVQSADAAMGSVSGSNPAAKHFLSYEISAIPGPDYRFERWNDGNTNNPRTVTITSDSNFTAYFAPNSYTITYMDGQTELNVDTFDYRQPIREYTTLKQGWNFEGWNPEVPQLMPAENLVVYAQWSRICDPVTDVDHNTYPTVGIGNICWMAENLRTTHYADGREITHIYEYQNEMYPNVQENVSTYGRLYDWYDAADSARPTRAVRVQGICPDGWYLPNEEDFELLNNVNLTNLRSVNYWLFNPGTNTTGYDLRPAGMYNFATSRYEDLHGYAYLWSVTSISSMEAHCHMADCNCYMLIDLVYNKRNAFSVRCVKD